MSDTQPDIWLEIKIPGGDKLVIGSYYREVTGLDGNNSLESQKERLKKWMASVNKVEEEGKVAVDQDHHWDHRGLLGHIDSLLHLLTSLILVSVRIL